MRRSSTFRALRTMPASYLGRRRQRNCAPRIHGIAPRPYRHGLTSWEARGYLPRATPPRGRMAEQPKKPRNIKDLKARLGRTVQSPQTAGGASSAVPPPSLHGGGAVPPPAIAG